MTLAAAHVTCARRLGIGQLRLAAGLLFGYGFEPALVCYHLGTEANKPFKMDTVCAVCYDFIAQRVHRDKVTPVSRVHAHGRVVISLYGSPCANNQQEATDLLARRPT